MVDKTLSSQCLLVPANSLLTEMIIKRKRKMSQVFLWSVSWEKRHIGNIMNLP